MTEIYEEVSAFWQKVIDDLLESLKNSYEPFSSGNTGQEIAKDNMTPVTLISQGFEITLTMPDYWSFMDEGVSGAVNNRNISQFKFKKKRPPISAIRLFMFNRGIVGKNYRDIRKRPKSISRQRSIEKELNSIAFAIAYKIWRDGLRKTNFYSNVVNDDLIRNFGEQLAKEYGRLIITKLKI